MYEDERGGVMGSLSIQPGGHQQLSAPSECPGGEQLTPEEIAVRIDAVRRQPLVLFFETAAYALHDAFVREPQGGDGEGCSRSSSMRELLGDAPRQLELQGKPPGG
jgi:hypothetical protein